MGACDFAMAPSALHPLVARQLWTNFASVTFRNSQLGLLCERFSWIEMQLCLSVGCQQSWCTVGRCRCEALQGPARRRGHCDRPSVWVSS